MNGRSWPSSVRLRARVCRTKRARAHSACAHEWAFTACLCKTQSSRAPRQGGEGANWRLGYFLVRPLRSSLRATCLSQNGGPFSQSRPVFYVVSPQRRPFLIVVHLLYGAEFSPRRVCPVRFLQGEDAMGCGHESSVLNPE